MIKVYYWRTGHKHGYEVDTIPQAVDHMFDLLRRYWRDFRGCSWFHYFDEEGERIWL